MTIAPHHATSRLARGWGAQPYSYDERGRLIGVAEGLTALSDYDDDNGNRLSHTGSYDAGDRLGNDDIGLRRSSQLDRSWREGETRIMRELTAILHAGDPDEGGFWATCLEVPGANGLNPQRNRSQGT